MTFADRLTGQPGVLVDLGGGKVAACSAICTHAGCAVQYSARQHLLVCPCHGAEFDPAQAGRVLRGPARRPLAAIPVTTGPDGTIYLQG
jgi:Rieske Fe-S protein